MGTEKMTDETIEELRKGLDKLDAKFEKIGRQGWRNPAESVSVIEVQLNGMKRNPRPDTPSHT